MQILKSSCIFIFIVLLLSNCNDKYNTFQSAVVTVSNNKGVANDTIIKDSVFNFSFSRLQKATARGLNATFTITPEHQEKDLYIVVSGKARTNYAHSNSSITLSAVSSKGELIAWKAFLLKYYYVDNNKWCYFKDSIFLKDNVDSKFYSVINVFGMLGDSKTENFDLDTLHVQLKEKI
jgi:hypothetical protein